MQMAMTMFHMAAVGFAFHPCMRAYVCLYSLRPVVLRHALRKPNLIYLLIFSLWSPCIVLPSSSSTLYSMKSFGSTRRQSVCVFLCEEELERSGIAVV